LSVHPYPEHSTQPRKKEGKNWGCGGHKRKKKSSSEKACNDLYAQYFAIIISKPMTALQRGAYHFHIIDKGVLKKLCGHIVSKWPMLALSTTPYSL